MARPLKGQAVAIQTGGDMWAFYSYSFEAYQNTILTQYNKQFYYKCDIYSTINFIFGDATVVFYNCNTYPASY